MAKGKHAAALFEVIHSGKPMRMPPPVRPRRESWLGSVLKNTGSSVAAAGSALRGSATALVVRDRPAAPPKMSPSAVDVSRDPARKLINFKLTYHTAIVAGFATVVVIGLAYAVGMRMNHTQAVATSSPSTNDLRAKAAHPDVLDVSHPARSSSELITPPPMNAMNESVPAGEKEAVPAKATTPAAPLERVIGRQYVIVQTFSDESAARAAKAFLDKNKFPATIENGLSGWAPKSKFCLVGTLGFDHIRGNADFDKYESTITKLGDAFSESSKGHRFEPHAYRWKGI